MPVGPIGEPGERAARAGFATATSLPKPKACYGAGDICERKHRYHALDADPEIGRRTDFFGAAAEPVLDTLDGTDQPMGQLMGGLSGRSVNWLRGVSGRLEPRNNRMAARIRAGEFDHLDRNGLNEMMIGFEQDLVQQEIDAYNERSPGEARDVWANINQSMRWQGLLSNSAIQGTYGQLRRAPDIRSREDRLTVGRHALKQAAKRRAERGGGR